MTCAQCGAACQGGLCRQCEIERAFQDQADELAATDFDEEGDDA